MERQLKQFGAKRVVPVILTVALAAAAIMPSAWAEDDMMGGGMAAMEDDPPMGQMPGSGMEPMDAMEEPMSADKPMEPMQPSGGMRPMGEMEDRGGHGMEMMGKEKPEMGMGMSAGAGSPTVPAASSLPAFAGAPGLYHMGATDFFLDHPEHIELADVQRKSLELVKAAAQKEQAAYRGQIEQRETELWTLTGAEQPQAAAIDAKVREIEALRVSQRGAYIQAVGKAGQLLTTEQRKQLTGVAPAKSADPSPAAPAPASPAHTPAPR